MNQPRVEKKLSHSIEAPQLSVIVASVRSVYDADVCLHALVRQARDMNVEIIVADCRQDDSLQEIITKYPDVIFIQFYEKTALPVLWGAGIARSMGQIIAVTDSACIVNDDWVLAILKAHQSGHLVIGGVVEAEGCKKLVDWAAYFCEYGQFMRPLKEGAAGELPGNNISFKRWALKKGQEFMENGFWKTYWCRKLQEEGIQLVSVPSIVVRDKKSYRLIPFLVRRFHHGRCFAGMRVSQASILTRVFYIAGSPLLPFLLLARTIATVVPKKRYRKQFILSFPISVLAVVLWSIGEFCGYLAGTGKSCAYIY